MFEDGDNEELIGDLLDSVFKEEDWIIDYDEYQNLLIQGKEKVAPAYIRVGQLAGGIQASWKIKMWNEAISNRISRILERIEGEGNAVVSESRPVKYDGVEIRGLFGLTIGYLNIITR